MSEIHNPDRDDLVMDLQRRVEILERFAGTGNSSVSKGAFEILSEEGLIVRGSALVVGLLNGEGELIWSGPVSITGAGGTLDVAADATLGGNTTIAGLAQLLSDLIVHGAGRIQVGSSMTLDPSEANGAVIFSNGGQVFTDSTTIQVYLGNGVVQISNAYAKLQWGGTTVRIDVDGIHLSGDRVEVQYDLEVGRSLIVPLIEPGPPGATITPIGVNLSTGKIHSV